MSGPTCDTLWNGRLRLWQPARGHGYRFNLDPVLLCSAVTPADEVLELGAGCGVLSILLLASGRAQRVTAIEVQPELAELAARNAKENGLEDRLHVVIDDLRNVRLATRADAVVFNPPYFRGGSGHGAPEQGRDAARHERHGTLADFVACAAAHLRPRGNVVCIIPHARADEAVALLLRAQLPQVRIRHVLTRVGQAPRHALIQATSAPEEADGSEGGAATEVLPPLVVHAATGRDFSPEVEELLRPHSVGD